MARRRGIVVRVKIHVQEVVGSNPGPAVETIYHAPLIWIRSIKVQNYGKITWHCCMWCNPANGRVEFEDGRLIKSSFITMDEMKACQQTRTKIQNPKKNKKKTLEVHFLKFQLKDIDWKTLTTVHPFMAYLIWSRSHRSIKSVITN